MARKKKIDNKKPKRILQFYHNTLGLEHDVHLLTAAFSEKPADLFNFKWDLHLRFHDMPPQDDFKDADIIIYYEHMMMANPNIDCKDQWLVVNPDFFDRADEDNIGRLKGMIHKSEASFNMFKEKFINLKHYYMGWTSQDPYRDYAKKDYNKCLMVVGQAYRRQLDLIISCLLTNKEFPETTITMYDPRNVIKLPDTKLFHHNIIVRNLSSDEMRKLQNECGIHICLGTSESFGHYIHEAQACKAVPIIMDGAPMNEFVGGDNGFLVKPVDKKTHGFYSDYIASRDTFYDAFELLQEMSIEDRKKVGEKSRKVYLERRKKYEETSQKWVMDILNG
tara:strand:+ start:35860 stop:36864 length:1005 start_codon:yes stop_codon:yes gene_type:complete